MFWFYWTLRNVPPLSKLVGKSLGRNEFKGIGSKEALELRSREKSIVEAGRGRNEAQGQGKTGTEAKCLSPCAAPQ